MLLLIGSRSKIEGIKPNFLMSDSSFKKITFKYVGLAILLSGLITFFEGGKTSYMQQKLCEDTKKTFIRQNGVISDMVNVLLDQPERHNEEEVRRNGSSAESACVIAYKRLKPTVFQEWFLFFIFLWILMTYVDIQSTKNIKE